MFVNNLHSQNKCIHYKISTKITVFFGYTNDVDVINLIAMLVQVCYISTMKKFSFLALTALFMWACSEETSNSANSEDQTDGSQEHVLKQITIVPGTDFVDSRNGKNYKTVIVEKFFNDPFTIDSLIWMSENLNFETEQSLCYESKDENCEKYGRLYNWADAQKACPEGWRLPYITEWPREPSINSDYVENIATEFSILYGGLAADNEFDEISKVGYFWTMETYDKTSLCAIFSVNGSGMATCNIDENYGLSVRCVKEVN